MYRLISLMLACMLITACAHSPFSKSGWLKNPFSKDKDTGDAAVNTTATPSLDQQKQIWYCYAVKADRSWDCRTQPDPAKEQSIDTSQAPGPQPPLSTSSLSNPQPTSPLTSPPVPQKMPVLPSAASKTGPDSNLVQDAASTPLESNKNYLNQQPGDAFSVQLIALDQIDDLLAFAEAVGIDEPVYTRIRTSQGLLIVLLLGVYDDMSAAKTAADSWLEDHPGMETPWVRRLSSIQAAMEP